MKVLVPVLLSAVYACASHGVATRSQARESCGADMLALSVGREVNVRARPDGTADILSVTHAETPVCASSGAFGFGFHRVKLPGGAEGFVEASDLGE